MSSCLITPCRLMVLTLISLAAFIWTYMLLKNVGFSLLGLEDPISISSLVFLRHRNPVRIVLVIDYPIYTEDSMSYSMDFKIISIYVWPMRDNHFVRNSYQYSL